MNKPQVLHQFWSQFGVPAFNRQSVPTENDIEKMGMAPYPRITYEVGTNSFDSKTPLTASIWDRSTSWEGVYRILTAVTSRVGRGGQNLHCDGGAVQIYMGDPISQEMSDPDDSIKRLVVNIEVEFDTEV